MTCVEIGFKIIEVILEYLKVFLSWPVVVFALFLYFLRRHKDSIDNLISRINAVSLAGGVEFGTGQVEKIVEEKKELKEEISKKEDAKEETLTLMLAAARQENAAREATIAKYRADLKTKETEIETLRMRDWLLTKQLDDNLLKNELLQMSSRRKNILRAVYSVIITKAKTNPENPIQEAINTVNSSKIMQTELRHMGIIDEAGKITSKGERIFSMIPDCWGNN